MYGQLIAILLSFLYIFWWKPAWLLKLFGHCTKNAADIPGKWGVPFLGTWWVFTRLGGYAVTQIHEYYSDMFQKFGPIFKEEAFWNTPVISVVKRADIEKVYKSSGKYPIRPPTAAIAHYRNTRPDKYSSTGMVNEQGEYWSLLRTNLAHELGSVKTINSFLSEIEEISNDWCNIILETRSSQNLVNLDDLCCNLGLEAICAFVLGRRMGFLYHKENSEIAQKLAATVKEHFLACRDTYFGLPFWKVYPTEAYKKLVYCEDLIYDLVLELIKTADDSTKESLVFQSVIRAKVDDKEKTAAIVDFIAAGIYTLRNSLIFLLHLLGKHENSQNLILEDFKGTYTKACVQESFRLYPTANALARITEQEIELSGYKIPSGSVIQCHSGLACRSDTNFTNANQFLPSRWLGDQKLETANAATYLVTPFGIGKRTCPGKRFIEQALHVLTKRTVEKFKISTVQELELQFEFLLAPKAPISMIFEDRR